MSAHTVLELRSVEQAYDAHVVVADLSFRLERGAIGCILGPSGCGKTTLLRGIAGFEPVRAGEILIDGAVATRPGFRLAPEHRRIGMVFQDYALFPHLTVHENVRFGLRSLPQQQSDARVAELAALVGIGDALDQYPHELSGGQQQRTALGAVLEPGRRPARAALARATRHHQGCGDHRSARDARPA